MLDWFWGERVFCLNILVSMVIRWPSADSWLDAVDIANNASGWAFNAAVPMGGAAFQNQARQLGGNVSFAQSLSGSQPATPLDLSYVLSIHLTSVDSLSISPSPFHSFLPTYPPYDLPNCHVPS